MPAVNHNCSNSAIAIRIELGTKIGVNRGVFRALGDPRHICFWWGETEKVLLIGISDKYYKSSLAVPNRYYETNYGFTSGNMRMQKAIGRLTGWKNGINYRIAGTYAPEINMVAFQTNEAVIEGQYKTQKQSAIAQNP
jgi:hypothetical protein